MASSNLWNKKNLEAPFVSSYKTTRQEINVQPLADSFKEAAAFFGKQNFLENETALLSRCIYRIKTKFRSDKGTKEMQKLNRALLQYLRINFVYHVQNFSEMMPEGHEEILYLPTKNMLDYVLVRLQGVAKLMCRAAECARAAARSMEQKIALGQFWKIGFISFALVSRLWVLVTEIVKFCCKFFDAAVQYSSLLRNNTSQWLPVNYVFPKNLKEWLGASWFAVDDSTTNQKIDLDTNNATKAESHEAISLRGFESSNHVFETIVDERKPKENCTQQKKKKNKNKNGPRENTTNQNIDLEPNAATKQETNKVISLRGFESSNHVFETIVDERKLNENCTQQTKKNNNKNGLGGNNESQQQQNTNEGKKRKRKKSKKRQGLENTQQHARNIDFISSLNTVKEFKKFLQSEDHAREASIHKCILRTLDKLQWNITRKQIKNLLMKASKAKDGVKSNQILERAKDIVKQKLNV